MNNSKVLSTIGIFIIAPVMMFAYITGQVLIKDMIAARMDMSLTCIKMDSVFTKAYRCGSLQMLQSESDSETEEDEIVTMTHAQLEEFVQREVTNDPFIYGVVSQRDYNKLKTRYDAQKLRMELLKRRNANSWVGIPITALIGVLCCRKIYKMYNK